MITKPIIDLLQVIGESSYVLSKISSKATLTNSLELIYLLQCVLRVLHSDIAEWCSVSTIVTSLLIFNLSVGGHNLVRRKVKLQ